MEQLPFEPANRSKKKKTVKAQPQVKEMEIATAPSSDKIPEVVNRRIVRRVALFCGVPTFLGFTVLLLSYGLVSQHILALPNAAVILVSMLFLGLGVVGMSYGAISASWDIDRVGSWWGWQEFRKNLGYLTEAWKANKDKQQGEMKS